MSDTAHVVEAPPAKPKRKYTRRPRKAAPEPKPSPYEGMNARHPCAFACRPDRCVITQTAMCASPYCGGPRADHMYDPGITRRYAEAKAFVAHAKVDNRFK